MSMDGHAERSNSLTAWQFRTHVPFKSGVMGRLCALKLHLDCIVVMIGKPRIANAGQHQEQTDVLWPAPPCQDPSPQQKQGITGDVLSTRSLTVTTVPSDSDSAHHTDDEGSSGQSMVNQGDEIAITAMGAATAAVVANAARFVFDAVAEEPAALKLLEATVEGSALLTSEAEAAFASAGGAGYPAAGTEEVADDETKPDPPSSSSLAKTEVKGEVQNVTTAGHEPPENEADPMNGAPELPGTQTTAGRPGRLRLQARAIVWIGSHTTRRFCISQFANQRFAEC